MVRELLVVAGFIAADQAGDAGRKHHALVGLRMGVGTEAAAAVAGVAPDIKSGPVVDGLQSRRLERHVGRRGGVGERQQAEPNAMLTPWFGGSDSLDGFFQREHPGGFFRHLQFCWRTGTDPEIPAIASKSRTRTEGHPPASYRQQSPCVIASNSQLQQNRGSLD